MNQQQFSDDCVAESITRPDRPREMAPTNNHPKSGYCYRHKRLGCEECKDEQEASV